MVVIWIKTGSKKALIQKYLSKPLESLTPSFCELEDDLPPTKEGDFVLACGAKAVKILAAQGIVKKNLKLNTLRGTVFSHDGASYMVTFDPYLTQVETGKKEELMWDVNLFKRFVSTGSLAPSLGAYTYVDDFSSAIDCIKTTYQKTKHKVPISIDLETVGLDPYDPKAWIVSVAVCYREGFADVLRFESSRDAKHPAYPIYNNRGERFTWHLGNTHLLRQIDFLLNDDAVLVRGANFKFDLAWMYQHWGLVCTRYVMDTTLVGSLLDENRSNSLNLHAKVFSNIGGYDDAFNCTFDKSRMDKVPAKELLPYAGGDVDACLQVSKALAKDLSKDKKLKRFYTRLAHPANRAFEKMERTGLYLDVGYYHTLHDQLQEEMQKITIKAMSMVPHAIKAKYADNLSLTRDAIIRDFLFSKEGLNIKPKLTTAKSGVPSVAREHLQMFQEEREEVRVFLDLLSAFNSAQKTDSTYVLGFMKHLRADGRFHPVSVLYRGAYANGDDSGTVTGRTAFRDPAVQTIPKHTKWAKALRKGYVAPPGYVIVTWDYSQGELRITACIADEENMISAYRQGIDLHVKTGGEANGFTLQEMEKIKQKDPKRYALIRQGGKAGNFGLIYGMQPKGFVNYARNQYGIDMSLEEAQEYCQTFFTSYPGLPVYHDRMKRIAKKYGYVRSPLGRVRHLPLITSDDMELRSKSERQAINSPVQSTLSDMSQKALAVFDQEYASVDNWPEGCQFCLMTHDSLSAYVKENEIDKWVPRVRHIMENLDLHGEFEWDHQLQFPVDAEVGLNLAETEKAY